MIAQQREYKKKKALKKAQRIKELEQEREDQKVKWQQFNNRAYSKNKKGQVCLLFVYISTVKDHRILCSNLGEGKKAFLKVVCSPVTYLKCALGYFVLSRPSFALNDFEVFLWGWVCTYLEELGSLWVAMQHLLELRSWGLSKATKPSYVYNAAHMAVSNCCELVSTLQKSYQGHPEALLEFVSWLNQESC